MMQTCDPDFLGRDKDNLLSNHSGSFGPIFRKTLYKYTFCGEPAVLCDAGPCQVNGVAPFFKSKKYDFFELALSWESEVYTRI